MEQERPMADRLASRRLQLVLIDPEYLRAVLDGQLATLRYSLPADASILNIHSDASGLCLTAVVHSASFPVVPPHEIPPHWHGSLQIQTTPVCPRCGEALFCPCRGRAT